MRRRGVQVDYTESALAFTAAAGYVGLVFILTWQALRGQSIVRRMLLFTLLALGVWLAATVGAAIYLPSRAAAVTLHSFQGAEHER